MSKPDQAQALLFEAGDVVDRDHPCLAGHFPGQPVAPAVLLLGRVLAAVRQALPGQQVIGLPMAKFPAPLAPATPFEIHLQPLYESRLRFECRAQGRLLAHGEIAVAPALARAQDET